MIAAPIAWSPSISVGDDLIDDQHRTIMERCARISQYANADNHSLAGVIRNNLLDLLILVDFHFETEEELLSGAGYPDVQAHMAEHAEFKKKLSGMYVDYVEGGLNFTTLINCLIEWFNTNNAAESEQFRPYFCKPSHLSSSHRH